MSSKDESSFRCIYEKYFSPMLTYAITVVDDLELAEEIVQDVFVIAWNKYEDLMLSPNPGGWLMNTTKFTIRNTLRKIKANGPTPLPLDDTICLIDRNQDLEPHSSGDELISIIAKHVPTRDLFILQKVIMEGYSCLDVAEMLKIKPATCQKRFQRVLKRLRKIKELQQY